MFDEKISLKDSQILTSIFKALDDMHGANFVLERRTRPRVRFSRILKTDVIMLPGKGPQQIFLRDISTSGLGFVSRRAFPLGSYFVLVMRFPESSPMRYILCRVTFSKYATKAMHEVGAAFESALVSVDKGPLEVPMEWIHNAAEKKDLELKNRQNARAEN